MVSALNFSPPVIPVQPSITPQQVAALAPTFAAAQATARAVETQTTYAPAATGRTDQSRKNESSTFVGYAFDRESGTLKARANPASQRGTRLNISA
jgi:hypothetical protein